MNPATPEEVCRAVSLDLKARGYTQQKTADTIGKSRAIVSNLLSSKKRFSKQMAVLFNRAFGYNIPYLLYGEGQLLGKQVIHDIVQLPISGDANNVNEDYMILASLVDIAEGIIRVSDDSNALGAWQAVMKGDFTGYVENMDRLSAAHNGRHYSPILAKFACDKIKNNIYLPIIEDIKGKEQK